MCTFLILFIYLGDFGAAKRLQTLVLNSNQTLIG